MADAGRVIAGTAAGLRLIAPPGTGTRPLADRVKQTLFAILEPSLPGAHVLDLFAGSGAAGIEALSRGAASAIFVERDPRAAATIAENLRRTGFGASNVGGSAPRGDAPRGAATSGTTSVVQAEAVGWLRARAAAVGPFDIAILDPPYADTTLLADALAALGDPAAGLLSSDARAVAKHFWRDAPPDRIGLLASERVRRFGETALTFYRSQQGAS